MVKNKQFFFDMIQQHADFLKEVKQVIGTHDWHASAYPAAGDTSSLFEAMEQLANKSGMVAKKQGNFLFIMRPNYRLN